MNQKNFDNFIQRARSVHGYKYEYISYVNMRTHITLSYRGITMSQCPKKHLMGRCPEKVTPKKDIDQFIKEARREWGNRFDYSNSEYNGSLEKIEFYDWCGNRYVQRASSHLEGVEPRHVEKTKYSDCELSIWAKSEIREFLDKKKIEYYEDYNFDDCESILGFDFYIPSKRMCIEFYSNRDYEKLHMKIDNQVKEDYCEDNYLDLVQLNYKQVNILWELLKDFI